MSWPAFISRLLEATNKVDKVAVFNANGAPIAATEDLSITKVEGRALLNSLNDPSRSIAKIHVDGMDYICFQGNQNTLIGHNKTKKCTFVAHMYTDCMILVIGNTEGHGSFLFELKRNLTLWQKNQKPRRQSDASLSRLQMENNNANQSNINNAPTIPISSDLISQSDVLIDMQQTTETPTLPSELQGRLNPEENLMDIDSQEQVLY